MISKEAFWPVGPAAGHLKKLESAGNKMILMMKGSRHSRSKVTDEWCDKSKQTQQPMPMPLMLFFSDLENTFALKLKTATFFDNSSFNCSLGEPCRLSDCSGSGLATFWACGRRADRHVAYMDLWNVQGQNRCWY